ncbi:protein NUCLEAR FUSION DEFECTIVE 6, mitochondrial isoform X1 [Magnolia sinica]|uniref:protein NUCLEAR FUSION DEFECTIVE 6, mitochondrial isoform X1 n=1 Tax=Magnolia sinica TaxID=86752 RepID=UPI00265A3312|nr:protein NUCLEAR FUSION DEFECTIVE 6, mitochondrial isoform X1 [Magnolia sinica]XP_058100569.1 protein NUCLEAR FUSION DEFECTIVE 6, mitochondrial isoform X1 [Magnolia sinica]XP_058100570.1 protein NUCLEAR FUSION DEFECTIVE 6, mitochondrial isoform X1 [Magnolia sinica]XP_058100571.1 protein NUCLEAR FUSION DEFECTIVE 6, mitochondrial isoform X1 [Magnolia sinica]
MASIARSVIRSSSSIRNAAATAAKLGTEAKAGRSTTSSFFRSSSSPSRFLLRSPVEMSCCVETLLPLHTATSSALLTSMLSVTRPGYGWLSEGQDETR